MGASNSTRWILSYFYYGTELRSDQATLTTAEEAVLQREPAFWRETKKIHTMVYVYDFP
jgi:hypothetical protein